MGGLSTGCLSVCLCFIPFPASLENAASERYKEGGKTNAGFIPPLSNPADPISIRFRRSYRYTILP